MVKMIVNSIVSPVARSETKKLEIIREKAMQLLKHIIIGSLLKTMVRYSLMNLVIPLAPDAKLKQAMMKGTFWYFTPQLDLPAIAITNMKFLKDKFDDQTNVLVTIYFRKCLEST